MATNDNYTSERLHMQSLPEILRIKLNTSSSFFFNDY